MIVTYFGHFIGPLFQVCVSEGGPVPLAEAVLFHRLVFLVDKGGDVKRDTPSSSCGICQFGDSFQLYFPFFIFNLYGEGGEAELQLGSFDLS